MWKSSPFGSAAGLMCPACLTMSANDYVRSKLKGLILLDLLNVLGSLSISTGHGRLTDKLNVAILDVVGETFNLYCRKLIDIPAGWIIPPPLSSASIPQRV
jgi:hypothetical protein